MKRCAFLTLDERGDYVIDDELAIEPLAALGWDVSTVSWRQRNIPWSEFDAVVIRSTWDYWHDVPGFLDTLAAIERQARLANSLELVRWNLRKTYLRALEEQAVRTVPTEWMEQGLLSTELGRCADRLGTPQMVIKPIVGANGEDAFRIDATADGSGYRELEETFRGRGCMVQPFRARVLEEGEYSLFYFAGEFSHAILKTPQAGEFRSQEERGARITSIVPEARLAAAAQRAVEALPARTLYARVDLVRNDADAFEVMELELIEPSLYLRTHADAPTRFARAIDRWFSGAGAARRPSG
jgi:glutathione synthase/RimK-type ligase-like ATP-grasp enzyme